ncbi:hypothetical protein JRQ81_010788 [Phrynocephalus forsythii]|uniref:Tyr recombinase domain-containing protein n=1 Tax=Phrynocephalus forsythii TaxID=171643 RepID=A0A9Q0Y132_9SAUR|nr:hypothetical protein JRQ81_010788 [Phrynocephalus forsythii]
MVTGVLLIAAGLLAPCAALVAASGQDKSFTALCMADIHLAEGTLAVRISKTDQQGKGAEIVLGPCSVEGICPVAAMREYLTQRGSGRGYAFIHQNGHPLTKFQFATLTSRVLGTLGLGALRFGTHSSVTAAAVGYDEGSIRRLGRALALRRWCDEHEERDNHKNAPMLS